MALFSFLFKSKFQRLDEISKQKVQSHAILVFLEYLASVNAKSHGEKDISEEDRELIRINAASMNIDASYYDSQIRNDFFYSNKKGFMKYYKEVLASLKYNQKIIALKQALLIYSNREDLSNLIDSNGKYILRGKYMTDLEKFSLYMGINTKLEATIKVMIKELNSGPIKPTVSKTSTSHIDKIEDEFLFKQKCAILELILAILNTETFTAEQNEYIINTITRFGILPDDDVDLEDSERANILAEMNNDQLNFIKQIIEKSISLRDDKSFEGLDQLLDLYGLKNEQLGIPTSQSNVSSIGKDENGLDPKLTFHDNGQVAEIKYSGKDSEGLEIYTYKKFDNSGTLIEQRFDMRKEIRWEVEHYYTSGRIKKRQSKFYVYNEEGNGKYIHETRRDDETNSIECIYCTGYSSIVKIEFNIDGEILPSTNDDYELDAENILREFLGLPKTAMVQKDSSDHQIELILGPHLTNLKIDSNLYEEFLYRHEAEIEEGIEEVEANKYSFDLESCHGEIIIDVLKFIDPSGEYILIQEWVLDTSNLVYEVFLLNCELPGSFKDYFNGEFLIVNDENKFIRTDDTLYKNAIEDINEGLWEIKYGKTISNFSKFDSMDYFKEHLR